MELIELKSGLTVPLEVLQLGWALESRDLTLSIERDKLRVSGPNGAKPELSVQDVQTITRWKSHLIAILRHADSAE